MSTTNCLKCNAQILTNASICSECERKASLSLLRPVIPLYFCIIVFGFSWGFFDISQDFFIYSIGISKFNIPLFLSPFILILYAYRYSFIKGSLLILLIMAWTSFTFGASIFENKSIPPDLLRSLYSQENVSNYTIDGDLASAFVLNSKNTDVQRENLLKDIKGKVIIWEVEVYEVKKISERVYRIQTRDKGMFSDKKVVGTFIEITAKDTLEANFIEQIKTDQIIRIKGVFTGDSSVRKLNIKPAVLWDSKSKLNSDQLGLNPNKEEVIISEFLKCNDSYEMKKKCEAMEEALVNEFLKDNIEFQNDMRENKTNSVGAKYLENIPLEATKYYNIYNQCMNISEIVNTNTVNACSSKASYVAEKDMNNVLEKIYIKLKNDKNLTDSLKEFQEAWELNLNYRAKEDAVNIGPPQMGITLYTLTAQRIKFLESFLKNY